ncbi:MULTISPECIES: hypothetical protein [Bacillus cereus group]|uniref:hypothetical protein n=1 Tax=Bacillus cereus group TaxID=86661 RepID=UPI001E64FE8C|nr:MULTISPECIES: hypothetical protein [Bacillus cereus group]MCC2375825.1 hypothetical protein [Bacillus paranthracis]MCU5420376.1 hypothetical protein [Bacillus pacificus]
MEKQKRDWIPNPNGRPKNEQKQYRKKLHRFSKFEDAVLDMVNRFESKKDREIALQMLDKIK